MNTTKLIAAAAAVCLMACTNAKKPLADTAHTPNSTAKKEVNKDVDMDAGMRVGNVKSLTDAAFRRLIMNYEAHPQEWVYEGSRPAVVDFYATWCRPCKMMSPVVEELAKKYAGKVDFYKVDIDSEQQLAAAFGIQSIPTFLFIPLRGNPTIQMGAMQKEDFEKTIDSALAK